MMGGVVVVAGLPCLVVAGGTLAVYGVAKLEKKDLEVGLRTVYTSLSSSLVFESLH